MVSSDNERGDIAAAEELAKIAADPTAFLTSLVDKEALGAPVTLPDGAIVPRLPGYRQWLWDGEFCGAIGLRWQRGTEALPPHCLGHIGYAVVPWKQGLGYATRALHDTLQSVIEKNGGVLVEEFVKPPAFGSKRALRYRIHLE